MSTMPKNQLAMRSGRPDAGQGRDPYLGPTLRARGRSNQGRTLYTHYSRYNHPGEHDVEGVAAVEGIVSKPKYEWAMEAGLTANFQQVGKLLASMLDLYQRPDGGLLLVEGAQARAIESARDLAPLLIDTVRIAVTKNGKYSGEKPSDSVLNNMLRSRSFLCQLPVGPRGGDDPGRSARLDALHARLQRKKRNPVPWSTRHDREEASRRSAGSST